jgi:Mrp family chromosome partitioning ATPase
MSRNFELLSQIELGSELGAVDYPILTSTHRVAEEPLVSAKPCGAGEVCGGEMLGLIQSIFLSPNGRCKRRVVAFCGADGEPGSSSICANAGRALGATTSDSVCLVDANVRTPRLSGILGVDRTTLFPDVSLSAREQCTEVAENLWLAGGNLLADDRGSLKSVDELRQLISQLHGAFEYLLIDTPGINVSSDARLLGQLADAVVLVIEANSTRRLSARKAKETLDAAGVRLLGTVLHNRSFPIPEKLYKRL